MYITIDGRTQAVSLADTQAAKDLFARLQKGGVTVTLNTNGNFEIWGPLGFSLTQSDQWVDADVGDVVLYNGSNICLMYGENSYYYTRLGSFEGLAQSELRTFLKGGQRNIAVTLSADNPAAMDRTEADLQSVGEYISLNGIPVANPVKGIYIRNGKKTIK